MKDTANVFQTSLPQLSGRKATVALALNPQLSTGTVSWPSPSEGWSLEQKADLAPGTWSASGYAATTNGAVKCVTIKPPTGNLFFRLHHP